ncbi:hypothetical protein B0T22DRAFT_476506 [Podospora appendiculata]|uniref:Uncharacterized protein n=1 Tax=Podospora appendiculata TaxID=314037 RepID=A0AAE0XHX8_9PEZI|nr:hypothetical protein B0T22DRAFT_476506 [Podospora appendiculata]
MTSLTVTDLITREPVLDGARGLVADYQTYNQSLLRRKPGVVTILSALRPNRPVSTASQRARRMQFDSEGIIRNAVNFDEEDGNAYTAIEAVLLMAKHMPFMDELFDAASIWAADRQTSDTLRDGLSLSAVPHACFFQRAVSLMGDLENNHQTGMPRPQVSILAEPYADIGNLEDLDTVGNAFTSFWTCIDDYRKRDTARPGQEPAHIALDPTTIPLDAQAQAWAAWVHHSAVNKALSIQTVYVASCKSCRHPLSTLSHQRILTLPVPPLHTAAANPQATKSIWVGDVLNIGLDAPATHYNAVRRIALTGGRICIALAYPPDDDGDNAEGTWAGLVALVRYVDDDVDSGGPRHVAFVKKRPDGVEDEFWACFDRACPAGVERVPWDAGGGAAAYRNVFAVYELLPGYVRTVEDVFQLA